MNESILTSIKKLLGIDESYEHFDADVKMHINTTILSLTQMGIGPEEGFMVEDKTTTWLNFVGPDLNLSAAKTYIYLKVKLLFDPPNSSFVIEAIKHQITELEWRLRTQAEFGTEEVVE